MLRLYHPPKTQEHSVCLRLRLNQNIKTLENAPLLCPHHQVDKHQVKNYSVIKIELQERISPGYSVKERLKRQQVIRY